MNPFTIHKGLVAPLDAMHVDTDQIIPKQFLKRIERTGYEDVLFFDWRYLDDGKTPNPEFEMNAPRYQGASILLARDNFGCGSSREHAPWALFDYGIRSIIAPSFADIFFNNCFNNGMLPIRLSADLVEELFQQTRAAEGYSLEINLPGQKIIRPDGSAISFEITPFLKQRLLNGWDQIGLTLRYEDAITAYEEKRAAARNA
ncbi:MAG TPA: 3-isopropylmalate dehydratase small subunit [Candidatus Hydrogenedentes bacterium]|mgnify:CR=1 FL=1|jgi:3-isopropylmalate/(R)-2-methylmalate dehydratase small subunit|nr:MAG: 3-isopropylmalate dehydratase small subunit 1 [Candidatus Hydrogenedentes bacterium ADurb.Bin170]HOD96193.1 3-isopropylmalate dehydratase small subunit [Candidatus Hydrogenedentota bacterium]HOH42591.1 3-isopropylmalate dehydratase small subunit [Candidatus Hydrogenedentota bacterium]HOM47774.1 3-isopropylmalate dehydratase small subunit [Candidatus Hydrogenedentota bacterium]HOR51651.1 3-isopropylmalate dehydratase small subunit [Candidatus Hydrogenedentota bacterium]